MKGWWISAGLGIIAVLCCYYFIPFENKSSKETHFFSRIHTEEYLLKITEVSEKMKVKFRTMLNLKFALVILKWKNGNAALTIESKDGIMYDGMETFFLGVGVKQCKGHTISHWYEFQMGSRLSEQNPNTERRTRGKEPMKGYLPINQEVVCSGDELTVFVRTSSHPSPLYDVAENRQGYPTCYNDVAEDEKSTHEFNKGRGDERLCLHPKVLNNLSNNLKDLFLEEKDPDVRIIVRNETLRAHRAVLKARSSALAAMLNQETSIIREEDYDSKDFEIFLLFLYSGTVNNLYIDNVKSVYNIADKYKVHDLREACAGYMVSKLTVHSVSSVMSVALKHEDYKLQRYTTDFFLKHAEKIFPTIEWQTFLKENPTTANELVIKSYSYESP